MPGLSVAGARAGLAGARSGLFMEQIRIITEMREESCKQKSSPKIEEIENFLENEKVYTKPSLQAEIFCRPRK